MCVPSRESVWAGSTTTPCWPWPPRCKGGESSRQPPQDPALEAKMRGLPGAVLGSEDCLHLAVHTPVLPSANSNPKLPVMVSWELT